MNFGPRRGHPLVALGMMLTAWVSLRVAVWHEAANAAFHRGVAQSIGALPSRETGLADASGTTPRAESLQMAAFTPWPATGRPFAAVFAPVPIAPFGESGAKGSPSAIASSSATPAALAQAAPPAEGGWFGYSIAAPSSTSPSERQDIRSGRRSAWFLSLLHHDGGGSTAHLAGPGGNEAPAAPAAAQPPRATGRWSGDSWYLVRHGGAAAPPASAGPIPATYGADQTGAVLRYALSRQDPHHLAAYGRVTSALNGTVDSEIALGLQGRPIASVPVVALGEVRVSRRADGVHLRPSVMAVTQLPTVPLAFGAQGNLYLQGGYVAGPYATAFIDGQVHFDRRLTAIGKGELLIGGGGWGGAQKGAARLDLGPEASWRFGLGHKAGARVSVDYRFKVAGDAEPPSGPALTLAAGF
jgi:hypothetical protein